MWSSRRNTRRNWTMKISYLWKSIPPNVSGYKAKCPGIWKRLGEPVDGRVSTDTETSEMATLMENILGLQSPEGTHEADRGAGSSRTHHSDRQHNVLSNDSRKSRGYSSDSLWLSSRSTSSKTSKHCQEHKAGGTSSTRMSDWLDVPEIVTPNQSPQQKQLKMADLEAQGTMPIPTGDESSPRPGSCLNSQVVRVPLPEQGILPLAVQWMVVSPKTIFSTKPDT